MLGIGQSGSQPFAGLVVVLVLVELDEVELVGTVLLDVLLVEVDVVLGPVH